jgi:hypothetical protein
VSRFVTGKKQAVRNVSTATGTNRNESTSSPNADYINFIDNDAVLNSNLRQLQDGVFENYPRIDDAENTKADEYNKQLEKTGFGKKFKNQFVSLWHEGNMFFEVDVVGNKLIGFYEIDANTIKTIESDKGEIISYTQTGVGNKDINLPVNKIIHIKAPSLRTGVRGKALLTPLKYPLNRKQTAENYLAGIIDNLHPLLFLELGESDDDQVTAIQNELRAKREPLDQLKIISLLTDEKVGRVDTGTTDNFEAIRNYINDQNDEIIRVVQIPPIVAGTVDNSNRSNSEIQERAVFGRTAKAWQNFFIDELNRQFEEKVGWKNFSFEFPETDDRKKEAALVRASKFKELGYTPEAIHSTLVEAGFKIEKEFVEPEELNGITKDINDMPSRAPRPKEGIPQNEAQRQQDVQNNTKKVSQ